MVLVQQPFLTLCMTQTFCRNELDVGMSNRQFGVLNRYMATGDYVP